MIAVFEIAFAIIDYFASIASWAFFPETREE